MESVSRYKNTIQLLEKYGLNAKKRLGQNFIIEPSVVEKIAEKSGADQVDWVLEIGPGLGALTQQLSQVSKTVIAVEIDDDMVQILSDNLQADNVKVIHQDFLEVDLNQFKELGSCVVCANVPYYITTPILFKLIESDLKIKQMSLMVQKEVAMRLKADVNSKEYNALSVMMDYLFDQSVILKVPAQCFHPRPKVDSMVIQLTFKNQALVKKQQQFFDFLKLCFTQRRKTLANNLKAILDTTTIEQLLISNDLKLSVRAQELCLNQFVSLYRGIYEA